MIYRSSCQSGLFLHPQLSLPLLLPCRTGPANTSLRHIVSGEFQFLGLDFSESGVVVPSYRSLETEGSRGQSLCSGERGPMYS